MADIILKRGTTQHLTQSERYRLRMAMMAQQTLDKIQAKKDAVERRIQTRERRRALAIAKAKIETTPTKELIEMFGPTQTALPNEIRPTDDLQLLKGYDEEVPANEFIEELAKQAHFKEGLIEACADPKVSKFLKLIGQVEDKSMSWCAAACGLNSTDLARIWRDGTLAQAFFRIVKRMPDLAEKVADDAMGKRKACPRCDGFGRIDVPQSMREFFDEEETTICPNCEGKKTIPTVGSAPDKQLIFEKVGWSKTKGGVNVSVNMSDHSIDATMGEMDGIEGQVLEHKA